MISNCWELGTYVTIFSRIVDCFILYLQSPLWIKWRDRSSLYMFLWSFCLQSQSSFELWTPSICMCAGLHRLLYWITWQLKNISCLWSSTRIPISHFGFWHGLNVTDYRQVIWVWHSGGRSSTCDQCSTRWSREHPEWCWLGKAYGTLQWWVPFLK